jgi:hypothetical protein
VAFVTNSSMFCKLYGFCPNYKVIRFLSQLSVSIVIFLQLLYFLSAWCFSVLVLFVCFGTVCVFWYCLCVLVLFVCFGTVCVFWYCLCDGFMICTCDLQRARYYVSIELFLSSLLLFPPPHGLLVFTTQYIGCYTSFDLLLY